MNIVFVLIDSLNRDYLGAYGGRKGGMPVATPNLDAFAQRAWRFDNHFVGSLPCMPARREIFAGIREMLWRPWGSLEPFDVRLPRQLEDAGYRTALVTDHYHYWEESANGYLQSFQSVEFIRGHEIDTWKPLLGPNEPLPEWAQRIEPWRPGSGRRYYSNVQDFQDETDFFPAKVMTAASEWLDHRPAGAPFYLHVESFDVHEPFDVPEPYASMYGDASDRDRFTIWPPYQDPDRLADFMAGTTKEELAFIRTQYAGKLTMVDRWFGELMETLDRHNLWESTAVIVTTDHGHDLGERGVYGKQFPHWDSHANIPLFVWHPEAPGNGRAISALTSTVDLHASLLDLAGLTPAERTHSRSIMPLMTGERTANRSALIYGTFGQGVGCTDGDWTIIKAPPAIDPLYAYTALYRVTPSSGLHLDQFGPEADAGTFIPDIDTPVWRIPVQYRALSHEDALYHRAADPDQTDNRWDAEPEQRARMLAVLRDIIAEEGAPPEQWTRLGLAER